MAEFLAGASGWYDHEPSRPLNLKAASALSTFKVGVELYLYDGLPVRRR